jgi:hypothetical protein
MDCPVQAPDDSLHDDEPKATAGGFSGEERVEHARPRVQGHAASRIKREQLYIISRGERRSIRREHVLFYCHAPGGNFDFPSLVGYRLRRARDKVH